VDVAIADRTRFVVGIEGAQRDVVVTVERRPHRVGTRAVEDGDQRRPAGLAGKGDGQRHRHDNRKDERPEHRLGFADELAEPRQRQLDERVADLSRRHGDAGRSGT
jgi:hypothetical protein